MSHKILWEKCVLDGRPMTIAEDDAVFNKNFVGQSARMIESLPGQWDMIHWGWNFDSILHVSFIHDRKQTVMRFDPRPLKENISRFQDADYQSIPFRLLGVFGMPCYTISPKGAGVLLARCFPLMAEPIFVVGLERTIPNGTLDFLLNKHFAHLRAYVAFPPLVWTDNEKSKY